MFEAYFKENWISLSLIAAAILLAGLLLYSYGAAIRSFIREVRTELLKASWPWEVKEKGFKRYKELIDSTTIVVLGLILMSGYVAFWDFLLVNIVGYLTQ